MRVDICTWFWPRAQANISSSVGGLPPGYPITPVAPFKVLSTHSHLFKSIITYFIIIILILTYMHATYLISSSPELCLCACNVLYNKTLVARALDGNNFSLSCNTPWHHHSWYTDGWHTHNLHMQIKNTLNLSKFQIINIREQPNIKCTL